MRQRLLVLDPQIGDLSTHKNKELATHSVILPPLPFFLAFALSWGRGGTGSRSKSRAVDRTSFQFGLAKSAFCGGRAHKKSLTHQRAGETATLK